MPPASHTTDHRRSAGRAVALAIRLAAFLLIVPAGLGAQAASPAPAGAAAPADSASDVPGRASSWLHWQHMTGDWYGGRGALSGRGLELLLTSVTDGSIGLAPGASARALRSLLTVSVAVDLGEAVGWRGARALWQAQARPGGYRAALIGELQGTTNIDAPAYASFAEVWLEQRLGGARVKAGWIDLSTELAVAAPASEFLNPSFAVSPTQAGFPTFPDPRAGAVAELAGPAPALRLAAFATDRGARAPDFGYAEVDVPVGGGRVALGAWHRSATDGAPRQGVQLVAERGFGLAASRELAVFLRWGASARGAGVREHYALGLVGNALARAADLAGAAWTHVAVAGEAGRQHESIVELFYAWRAAPWLELRPDVQLVHGAGARGAIATLRVSVCH